MKVKKSNDYRPVEGNIMTRWAEEVTPENVLKQYPRPQMVRSQWQNLNGLWQYAITPKESEPQDDYDGNILVPFCIESALSGVKKSLLPEQLLWYRRTFTVEDDWLEKTTLLHFGAVDWECRVFINGNLAGSHTGGYIPFSFDITQYIHDGKNEIIVSVWDPSDAHWQQKGKQKLNPGTIYYTPSSGIWQTVWLESVANSFIKRFKITPDIDKQTVTITCIQQGDKPLKIKATATDNGDVISTAAAEHNQELILNIVKPKLWSPDSPYLYDLTIQLMDGETVIDSVDSYFGMRKFSIIRDDNGIKRLALNNEILFHNGPLDQGYWPDGIYTAPTDDALKFDIQATKELGFNMIRKHIKVEPARWYYWCDKLGIIVWQDMVNGGKCNATIWDMIKMLLLGGKNIRSDTTSKEYTRSMREEKESRDDFEREYKEMIDHLYNAACIGVWVPFNESWGQFDADRIGRWTKQYDPSRSVDHASGWWDQGTDDLQSYHMYFKGLKLPKITNDRAIALSEYGGYTLQIPGHTWTDKVFGYKKMKSPQELQDAYTSLIKDQLMPLKKAGYCAAVYTQTTDVEMEINGFYTYDRKVLKMDQEHVAKLNRELTND